MPEQRRFPFGALADAMGMTEPAAARELGITGSRAQTYRKRGILAVAADRLAVKAGLHPYVVWPEMADDAQADAERAERARAERRRESDAAGKRRRYHDDAAYRARRQEYMKAYRQTAKAALTKQRAQWAAANPERKREITRDAMRRLRARTKETRDAA